MTIVFLNKWLDKLQPIMNRIKNKLVNTMGNFLKWLPSKIGPKIAGITYKYAIKNNYIYNLKDIDGMKFVGHVQ